MLDPAGGGDPLEHRMRQRLLEIVAPGRGQLLDLGAQEVVIPGALWIVVGRGGEVVEPDLDCDQQTLRRADLELVESDIGLDGERFEQDSGRPDLERVGHEAGQLRLAHDSPRNWTSRSRPRKRWPESITSSWPVTQRAPTR